MGAVAAAKEIIMAHNFVFYYYIGVRVCERVRVLYRMPVVESCTFHFALSRFTARERSRFLLLLMLSKSVDSIRSWFGVILMRHNKQRAHLP